MIFGQENIFWLDISMEDAISVHMVDGLKQLVHIILDSIFRQIVSFAFNCIVHVHVHQLKYKCKTTGGLIVENFI